MRDLRRGICFQAEVKKQLALRQMTYKELADATGFSQSYVSNCMSTLAFSDKFMRVTARVLGIELAGIERGIKNAKNKAVANKGEG